MMEMEKEKEKEIDKSKKASRYLFDRHDFTTDVPFDYADYDSQGRKKSSAKQADQEAEPAPAPAAAPPPPIFSEKELNDAIDKAHAKGMDQGYTKAKAELEQSQSQALNKTLQALVVEATKLGNNEKKRHQQFEQDALQMTKAIIGRLFPKMLEKRGEDEVISFIQSIISSRAEQGVDASKIGMAIKVAPDQVPALQSAMQEHGKLNEYAHCIQADTALKLGDCQISWENGGAIRNMHDLMAQIEQIIDEYLAPEPISKQDSVEQANITTNLSDKDNT